MSFEPVHWLAFVSAWCLALLYAGGVSASTKGLRGPVELSMQPIWRRIALAFLGWIVFVAMLSLCIAPFLVLHWLWAIGAVAAGWLIASVLTGVTTAAMQRGWPLRQDHIAQFFLPLAPFVGIAALSAAAVIWWRILETLGYL